MMQVCNLSKSGFGSIKEIQTLDSDEFLDLLEYESISNDIHKHILGGD